MKAFHIRHRKRINRIKWFCRELVVMFALYIFCANMAFANPYGPQVVSGSVQFNPQGNTLNITNSPNAVINWQGFSIGTDEITRFLQQSPSSAVLNRVIGQDPSAILGVLQSNGRVFLINPNGVLFGQGARIEVNGLAASTLNISDTDFLSGRYNFTAGAAAGGIQNQGSIVTPAGGRVYLIAPDIENTGIIHSPGGEVLLAAGHSVQLVDSVNPDMAVVISAPENKAVNLGQIIAESGKVGIYGGLIQHSGMVKADSAVAGENGRIFFKATKGVTLDKDSVTSAKGIRGGDINIQSEAGDTRVSGTVTATGSADQGGQINILGASVALTDNASLDASGATGGGTVLVGGDFLGRNPDIQNAETTYVGDSVTIKADALDQGTGGNVAVWANESTTFNGAISARGGTAGGDGGRVETSGHKLSIGSLATVNTLAPAGKTGSWLLDPTHDYFIAAVGGDITGAALSADLNTTDVEIWSEDGDTAGTGNIYVNDPVSWGLGTKLTLTAESDVFVNAKIENTNSSAGGVYFNTSDPSNVSFGNNGKVVIHNIEQLQWMNTALSGRYELGGNIDAADTINWNDAMGFEPVGESSDYPFRGFFDGMDHTISDLFINRPASDHIGLFGYTNDATIQNVGLTNVNVTGGNQVGGLVGMQAADAPNAAVINNSYATGLVTGTTYVGGLVGKSNGGSISESYATVDVTGDDSVGGLVGLNHGAGPIICIIESSYATGDVSGNTNIGGLVGENHGDIGGSHSSGGVQGDMRVGGLVGKNFGTISESYASGNVQGNADIGGLVGHNIYTNFDYPGRIANSYATGAVTGTNTTGGLVGYNYGYIENTYATGLVNNGVGGADIGGLVGQDDSYGGGDTTNSFWDDTTTGQVSSAVGTAKTTAELMTASTYTDAIWDFNTIWWMSEGNTRPFLRSEYSTKIVNAHQLQLIALDLAANYTLGKDIDMGELQNPSGLWKTTTGFFPLGDFEGIPSTYFSGTFDGNNHIIDGLYINRPAKQYVGLFGNAAGPSVIQNVGLTNVDITGGFQTGGLAAHLGADAGGDPYGTISNCFTTGTVTGTSTNVGGLVGLSAGYISNSYSIAEVSGLSNVGGLLGTNLYAFSSVTNCYSTGVVIGDGGGLVGLNFGGGPISNSFWDTQTSGRPTSAGGTGKTTVEMMTKSTFTDAGWNFANIWTIDEGVSYPCLFGPGCNPAALYWLLFTADNKIKTYGDANDFTSTITAPDGYAPGDDAGNITYEGEPAYSLFSENVGEWEILVTQGTLTSTKYDHFDFAPGLMTISKADLTLTAQTYTKIYDGTRSAAAIPAIAGLKFADTVTGARESYADKYAGTNKVLSVTGYTINDGNGGNNYHVTLVDNTTGVITARPITAAGITANDKVYDGNVNATLNLAGAELFGVIGHDAVTIDKSVATGLFDNKNVGIDKTVTVTGLGISGADTANYLLDPSYLTTANITPKAIIISGITANDKVYDGNVNATLNVAGAGFFGIIGGDAVNIDTASATGLFDNKNVGNGKNVQITGLGLNGQDAANYTVNTEAQTTANITALGITGSITAADKVYDGNTDAAILTRTLSGVIAGDSVTYTGGTAAFADKNAGLDKTVTATGFSLTGQDAANYTVNTEAQTTADITALGITGSITAVDKVYDGNTDAAILSRTLAGVIAGDTVTYTGGTAAFADKNAGLDKTVTATGLALSGEDAANYTVNTEAQTTADITALGITGSITAADKVYDGNTDAAILTRTLSGVIAGDTVTYAGGTAAFADKNAGLDKTVTATGLALSGADATNYTVNTEAQTIADITKASLTISGLAANNKTYDATRDAVLSGTPTLTGVLTGDSVTVIGAADTGIFDTKDVGTDKPVTANLDSLTLGGTDGGNYRITAVTTPLTADITALGITGNITVENKVYDGNTNATISGRTLSGVLGADDVHYTGGTAAFSDRNAGAGKMVTATELELSGEDAGNYTVNTEAQTTADIMQAPLIVTASTDAKIYDGTTSSSAMPAITGGYMIEGDSIAMKQAFDNKNAGEGKTLIPSVIIDDGNGGNNYNATMATDTTGVIGKAPLTITADDKTRIYGNANPEFTGVITGFAGGETLSMSGVAGSALYTTDAVQTSDAGTYDIIPETGTLSAVNYRFDAFVKGSLVIGKAPLSVISDDKTKFSGEANPAFTASYSGFTLGQTESVLGGSLSFETPATASSPIGNYPITPYGLTSGNYQIAFFDGNLLVNPPPSLQDEINAVVVAVNNTATAGGVKEAIIFFGKDNEEDTQSKEGQDAGEKREALPYCN